MRILYSILFCFMISTANSLGQTVKINEVMNWNTYTISDYDGKYNPWVELYNPGPGSINLNGYYLADHSYYLTKWKFPSITIPAGGYTIIFLSGKEYIGSEIHSEISLISSWEGLYLSDPSGNLVDHLDWTSMGLNVSYGRSPDGASSFAYFEQSTPWGPNNTTALASGLPAPEFSHRPGFYENSFSLSISNPDPSAQLRYTLDGSDPTSSSPLYTGPLTISNRNSDPNNISLIPTSFSGQWSAPAGVIEKSTVVKVRAFKAGHVPGAVSSATYFVDPDIKNRFNMPVVSVSTDYYNLFDYTYGINVPGKVFDDAYAANPSMPIDGATPANFTQRSPDWARPAHVEYFEKTGTLGFSQKISLNIHGGYSRISPQHAFNMKADKGFGGPNDFNYPVFPGLTKTNAESEKVEKFKLLMLRNGGSDWGFGCIRDALIHNLFSHRLLSTQAYKPCVLYLNGEYWGIYDLREKLDRDFLNAHYGLAKSSSTMLITHGELYEGDPAGAADYLSLHSYISNNDMSQPAKYDYVKTQMDVENYAEYFATEIFLNNVDWPGGNIRYWRKNTPYNPLAEYGHDGRWRWGLQDLDQTLSSPQLNGDYTYNALAKATAIGGPSWPNPDWSTVMLRKLLANPDFKNLFINTMADHMNSTLKPQRVIGVLETLVNAVEPEMPAQIERWNRPSSMATWQSEINLIKQFAIQRPAYQRQHIMNYFGIADTVQITLNVSGSSQGKIRINTMDVDQFLPGVNQSIYPWQGTYYQNVPVTLSAIPYPGYKFVRWEGAVNSSDPTITLSNSGDGQVTAVFEREIPFEPHSGNVNLYPNPATSTLNLEFTDENNGDIYIFVFDRFGKQHYSAGINKLSETATGEIDVSGFSSGIYFLRVKSSTGKIYKKKFSVDK
jgi:hypothetical protein